MVTLSPMCAFTLPSLHYVEFIGASVTARIAHAAGKQNDPLLQAAPTDHGSLSHPKGVKRCYMHKENTRSIAASADKVQS